jgi:hypothetical protein
MSKVNILVIEGGWVLVGKTDSLATEPQVELTNAHVIRRWGTDKGLGQIALAGPTKDTILDKLGVAFIERRQIRFMVPCDASKWKL